jgi:hypothetical protein
MCPIYFLYNWRWIKSHLWEVGAVTSSILVHSSLFGYSSGIYSSLEDDKTEITPPIGMLDITIVGWGQTALNLSSSDGGNATKLRWWYVIPHLGLEYNTGNDQYFNLGDTSISSSDKVSDGSFVYNIKEAKTTGPGASSDNLLYKSLMLFNRRFDDCNIESHAVGAVPYNFVPLPFRTPSETP